ncbi:uncharacterized protein K452DRAFT_301262 [Aplosporella prunicola CBS 121167]|uniref:GIT Spa2 homology (SHD) domain-containing protein n=1 Tax=Aplosporella prunicola CBS 121167 TaxID=1176127 RepID=A0A6A6B516_9PEZI|nr:uncharacterized protein K452DRAFT_301262 [Aplosporella prunicola CBS 121167]KAF2138304.1 hypothetical protein K452DRAFT_301262 [Aplosporella prunicola CBS 121167]
MAGPSGTLSPISVDSANEWSPTKHLGGSDNPYSPTIPPTPRSQLVTPPASVHTSSLQSDGGIGQPRTMSTGNPSPPSSIARSSNGDGMSIRDRESVSSRKALMIEEALATHYRVLNQYLAPYLRDEKGNPRPNRARDKLLRLSSVQFQELSTDVYDESIRREDDRKRGGPNNPNNNIPRFLPPKNNYHPKRNQARQKLSTLPLERFRQLATDVFYELERRYPKFILPDMDRPASPTGSVASSRRGPPSGRMTPSGGPPGGYRGPPGPGGPPYRRGPGPGGPGLGVPGNEYGRPLPKTFQQNTIVPNKGVLVEDDDDQSGADEDREDDDDAFDLEGIAQRSSRRTTGKSFNSISQNVRLRDPAPELWFPNPDGQDKLVSDLNLQVSQLQEKTEELEAKLKEKDQELERLQDSEREKKNGTDADKPEFAELREDLERKVEEAQGLNESLKAELEKVREESSHVEQDLRTQLEEGGHGGGGDSDLKQRYEQLERDFQEQQQVTEEVRREASQFLLEMRSLSERSSSALEKEEKLANHVSQLETELREWKARYARAKTQVRHLRASSMGLANFTPDASIYARDSNFAAPDGLIKDVHVSKFQLGIDELLQTARKPNPEAVLDCMKNVVVSVRHITADFDAAGSPPSSAGGDESTDAKRASKLKSRVSATANNLITASKNHAAAAGLSPVSLLDAAASHLTTAIVELVKIVKIKPTQPGEEDYEEFPDRAERLSVNKRNSYYGLANGVRHSRTGSNLSVDTARYSNSSSPRAWSVRRSEGPNGLNGAHIPAVKESSGLEEIKNYLEDQTTDLVNSIQPLVQDIRSTPAAVPLSSEIEQQIERYVTEISRTVQDISYKTREAIENVHNPALTKHAAPAVEVLEECREGLLEAINLEEGGKRDRIPPLAFKIARATKACIDSDFLEFEHCLRFDNWGGRKGFVGGLLTIVCLQELVLRVEKIENGELTADMTVANDF